MHDFANLSANCAEGLCVAPVTSFFEPHLELFPDLLFQERFLRSGSWEKCPLSKKHKSSRLTGYTKT